MNIVVGINGICETAYLSHDKNDQGKRQSCIPTGGK